MNYEFVEFNAATRVAAAINISCRVLKIDGLSLEVLSQDFQVLQDLIRRCSMSIFLQLCSPPSEKLTAVYRKFSQETYSNVSSLKISLKGMP